MDFVAEFPLKLIHQSFFAPIDITRELAKLGGIGRGRARTLAEATELVC